MWGACVTCTRVKVLGAGRKSYLYTCEGAGCGAQPDTCTCTHVRRCWVRGARVTCTREKVLGVGRKSYLYTCEGAGCGAQELPVHV